MVNEQNGLCAICKKEADLQVDHEHGINEAKTGRITGKIRGLLCRHCNTMLGHARDNISTLRAAIDYLASHPTSTPADPIYELGDPNIYHGLALGEPVRLGITYLGQFYELKPGPLISSPTSTQTD